MGGVLSRKGVGGVFWVLQRGLCYFNRKINVYIRKYMMTKILFLERYMEEKEAIEIESLKGTIVKSTLSSGLRSREVTSSKNI